VLLGGDWMPGGEGRGGGEKKTFRDGVGEGGKIDKNG